MADYTQVTAFTPKDSLSPGNPSKVVRGSEFDAEFEAVAIAIQTKADKSGAAFTGNISTTGNLTVVGAANVGSLDVSGAVTGIDKTDVGLGNVDNTSDANKPVSTATQTALNGKANISHTHVIADVTGLQTALDSKLTSADISGKLDVNNPSYTGTLTGGTGVINIGSGQFYKDASGNVGVGTASPGAKLDVQGSGLTLAKIKGGAGSNQGSAYYVTAAGSSATLGAFGDAASMVGGTPDQAVGVFAGSGLPLKFYSNAVERGQFDSAGNFGLGVTPSAWSASKAIEFGGTHSSISGSLSSVANTQNLVSNAYFDGSVWRYKFAYNAQKYTIGDGFHTWYTAPSGTAGNPISFTQAMSLDASGKLSINTADSSIAFSANSPNGKVRVRPYIDAAIGAVIDSSNVGESGYQPLTLVGLVVRFASGSGVLAGQFDTSGNLLVNRSVTSGYGKLNVEGGADFTNGNVLVGRDSGNLLVGTTSNPTSAKLVVEGKATIGAALHEKKVVVAAANIDVGSASLFTRTISGATTFTVSNVPATGTVASFILDLTNGGSATVTWWSGVKWAGGTAPTLTASGRDVLGFFTHDGGTTWTGMMMAKDAK